MTEPLTPTTTKQCPRCGNTELGLMRTLRLKYCSDCNVWMKWNLGKGQEPLIGPSRKVKKVSPPSG